MTAAAPRTIGRYAVSRLLGQGGMGRVWLARDTVLGRHVAIKVLRDDLALPPPVRDELIVRMSHEARAAAAVSHPNIVTLYDMGEDANVGLFLVFEFVASASEAPVTKPGAEMIGAQATDAAPTDGMRSLSLRDRLKRGPLPLPEVAKLAREVGTALTFAHEAGVIHRDVKPENILFSRTGFKVADFGIARIPESTITRANTILGTPAYTAPEALSLGEFGAASDQFSFAATLYEAATGTRAFAGEDAIVTAGKVSSEPPPPLERSIGPEVLVRSLDTVLQRGLAKTPDARFASCAELGQHVARAIENEGPRRTISGRLLAPLLTPIPGILDLERTPLSSRLATSERVLTDGAIVAGVSETPRPSIFIRRRTHRFQNIAAAIAVIVIVVLVLVGRRTPSSEVETTASASASSSPLAAPIPIPIPRSPPKPKAAPPRTSAVTDGGAPTSPVEGDD